MKKAKKPWRAPNAPQDISNAAWYYISAESVGVYTNHVDGGVGRLTIGRERLRRMLRQLKPRKARAQKTAKAA